MGRWLWQELARLQAAEASASEAQRWQVTTIPHLATRHCEQPVGTQAGGRAGEWMNERADAWMNGRKDGWTNG